MAMENIRENGGQKADIKPPLAGNGTKLSKTVHKPQDDKRRRIGERTKNHYNRWCEVSYRRNQDHRTTKK